MIKEIKLKIKPIFLLGSNPSFIRNDGLGFEEIKDKKEQEKRMGQIITRLRIETEAKKVVRKEEDLKNLETDIDAFIIFVHSIHRYSSIVSLANTGVPIILSGEETAPGDALDIFEYIADYNNVILTFSYEEIRSKIRVLKTIKFLGEVRVLVFNAQEQLLKESVWHNNPIFKGMIKTQNIDIDKFGKIYKKVDRLEAEELARKWTKECRVLEPSLEDIAKSARLYITMKDMIEQSKAGAAYVLWCGQFTEMLGTKMCFAISKLNDAGYLTGCWRGENLLPMLILSSLSEKSVFFGEVHTYKDGVLSLRHCAVPLRMSSQKPVLRRWREVKGTVSCYCEMPKGEATLLNTGSGDMLVALRGEVIETRDLGGENCRTTFWIKLEDDELFHYVTGREFAMVYGDYVEESKEVAINLGIETV